MRPSHPPSSSPRPALFLPSLSAQSPAAPAAAPPSAAPAAAPTATAPTVNVFTREVVVDVNVTDSKGNPVHDLTRDDFTVTEDGKPIVPRSFREHRSDEPPPAAAEPPGPPLPPNTFSNAGVPETIRPLYILLLDALDTPPATQAIVSRSTSDFIGKLAPGTRVAVFSLSAQGRLSIVQGFTADQDTLRKAVKDVHVQIPPLEDFGQDSTNVATQGFGGPGGSGGGGGGGGIGGGGGGGGGGMRGGGGGGSASSNQPPGPQVDVNIECSHIYARGQYTFNALAQIARYLSGMPGRKNVIWFTGAFPTRMNDKQNTECVNFRENLQVVEGLLEQSHAALFPIDPRALDASSQNSALSYAVRMQTVEHNTMMAMADATGGKALFNTNDLSGAAAKAVISGSNYYTITYSPPNQNWDTRVRTIAVNVDKPNLTLDYKKGYHALPPGTTLSGKPEEKPATPLQTAMMLGALQPSEVLFNAAVGVAPTPDTALAPNNNADPKLMVPPFRRFAVIFAIDANSLQFGTSADGNYHAEFDYAVSVYDAGNGQLLNSSIMVNRPNLPPSRYQSVLKGGALLRQIIDVPSKGDYILRIGVHDVATDRVGAIEVHTASIAPDVTPTIPTPPKPAP